MVAVCPIHGPVRVESLPATCPVKLRRTVAGQVEHGTCGQPLEPEEELIVATERDHVRVAVR
jgi:hypothetical protein